MKDLPKTPQDIDFLEVNKYAEKHSLNTQSEENWREARQNLFDELHSKSDLPLYIYDMRDQESNELGLLQTDMPEYKLEKEWANYFKEDEDGTLEDFINYCENDFEQYQFERVYCQATIYP